MKKTELFCDRPTAALARPFGRSGLLVEVDALRLLRALRDGVADVVFLDPPFNLGKDYGVASRFESTSDEAYAHALGQVLLELPRVLSPGGSAYLYHIPRWAVEFVSVLGEQLDFRHWIAVSMKNGFVRRESLYPAHYSLLHYSNGPLATFRRPKVQPSECRHCGRYTKDYGGYAQIIERQGLNLSDVWDDVSPVRHRGRKHRIANELPEILTDRVMHMSGRENGLLVDPFVGTGTSLISARRHGMRFVGGDISSEALTVARARLTGQRIVRDRPPMPSAG